MVGLLVTPTTCLVSISSCRLPVRSRSRLMSSSQIETPWAERSASGSDMRFSLWAEVRNLVAGGGAADQTRPLHRRVGGGDDPVGGEAELLVEHVALGAGAEVVDAD